MASLAVRRGELCLVTRDASGGWRHQYRHGVVVTPTPRGAAWRVSRAYTRDVFFWDGAPKAGDVVVELGAGCGTETVELSRIVGPSGRVIAVEAHPWTCELLRSTVAANALTNVTVVEAAIADQPGQVAISDLVDTDNIANSILTGGDTIVPAITIDSLAAEYELDRIDFLKMNIEGAERLAIRGMDASRPSVRRAVISCHDFIADLGNDDVFRTKEEVRATLNSWGWVVKDRPQDPRPWVRAYLYASAP